MQQIVQESFLHVTPDSAIYFGEKMLRLAKSAENSHWMGIALNIQGMAHQDQKDYDQAMQLFDQALDLFRKTGEDDWIEKLLSNIGNMYNESEGIEKQIEFETGWLKKWQELGRKKQIALSHLRIGRIYHTQAKFGLAIESHYKALEIAEEQVDSTLIAQSFHDIGHVHHIQRELTKALEFYAKSLAINRSIGNQKSMRQNLNNMANIHQANGDYELALQYHKEALGIGRELKDNRGIAQSLANIGVGYIETLNYEKAMATLQEALKVSLANQNSIEPFLHLNIGTIYREHNKYYNKAILHHQKALRLSGDRSHLRAIGLSLHNLYLDYKAMGQMGKALEMHEKYFQVNDSMNSTENKRMVVSKEYQYNQEKQMLADSLAEAESARLEKVQALAAQEARDRRNQVQYSAIVVIVLLLGSLIAISGKVKMKPGHAEGLIFIFFILLFEFILVITDPWVDELSGGEVGIKMAINSVFALAVFFGHQYFEGRLKRLIQR